MKQLTYNQENMLEFKKVVRAAYKATPLSSFEVPINDMKKCERFLRIQSGGKREARQDALVWRWFRQRAAQLYRVQTKKPILFEWQIDWCDAYEWVVKNWVTLLRILVALIGVVV